jgi:hypothetical protein
MLKWYYEILGKTGASPRPDINIEEDKEDAKEMKEEGQEEDEVLAAPWI